MAFFTLLGLSVFDKDGDGVLDVFQSHPSGFNAPTAPRRPNLRPMMASKRDETPRGDFTSSPLKSKTHVSSENEDIEPGQKDTESFSREGLRLLREALKVTSSYLPGKSFKADVNTEKRCVWIRFMESDHGIQRTESSAKAKLNLLDDALAMPENDFRARLESFLKSKGFEI